MTHHWKKYRWKHTKIFVHNIAVLNYRDMWGRLIGPLYFVLN